MDSANYSEILKKLLKPFIDKVYLDGHIPFRDHDPKHTSQLDAVYFEESGIDWWRVPPGTPDCNSIENVWHELKEYIH